MKNIRGITIGVVLLVAASLLMTGCFAGKQAESVKYSGFLGPDYKLLQKGSNPHQALYSYVKPGLNVASYKKILLDPVQLLRPADAKGAPSADLQKVANNFYSQLVAELSKSYEMVKEPGPNTMRMQVALTRVSEGSGSLQIITSVVPIGLAASIVEDMADVKPTGSGEASVEARITDAATGELLGAGVDRRIADRNIEDSMNTWKDLTKVTEIWSKDFAYRLCKMRGAMDCVSPFPAK